MKLQVFGIPACGTCRKARAWLSERGLDHKFVDLRESPPTKSRVGRWRKAFGAKAMRNTSGGSYRALGPERESWSDARWEEAYAADPMLIRRPVLEIDGSPVAIGFSAAAWEERLRSKPPAGA